ncbi:CPBP family intramembrane metalloprotease [candidate division KSB1 bacterium]|nr:CPBP family intramembrane metalloprotease [candidate division KSB1 bacterium]
MIVLILAFVVVAGIGEEMLFRGFLLGSLEKSVDVTRAVLYSSMIFTFMHFNPWWTIEIFFMGIIAGVITWKSNSLYPAIAMHALVNFIAFLLTNDKLPFLRLYLGNGHVTPIWLMVSGVCVVVGILLFYVCSRTIKKS